ncbi:MAG: hypothetical protein OEX12_08220 [Gammaproteobacteria bacterium]|nr:hypothetical protein [Gammaproteobacteria bacterium]
MDLTALQQDLMAKVQHNCHISDARFAGNYTMCIYLMKMREFYRWEHGFAFQQQLPKEEVGSWLRQRESLWESVESEEFHPLDVDINHYEPFEVSEVNDHLRPQGLIYGAGLGIAASPHFFLAELEQQHHVGDCTIHVAGRELARDLTSPPAMSQGKSIYIRKESLRRFMWERLENWNWNRPQNAMAEALKHFDVKSDIESSLDEMTELELESVLQHEFGEIRAGELLGELWHELLISLPRSRVEFMARAVRDLLADCLTTLPYLLNKQDAASIHLYIANLVGMRQELAPALKLAYNHWLETGSIEKFEAYVNTGQKHWIKSAQSLLDCYQQHGLKGIKEMQRLLEQSVF